MTTFATRAPVLFERTDTDGGHARLSGPYADATFVLVTTDEVALDDVDLADLADAVRAHTRTVIDDPDRLDALPVESVVRDALRVVHERWPDREWRATGQADPTAPVLPCRVLERGPED